MPYLQLPVFCQRWQTSFVLYLLSLFPFLGVSLYEPPDEKAAEGLRPLRGLAQRRRSREISDFLIPFGVRECDRRFVPQGDNERSRPPRLLDVFLFDGEEDLPLPLSRRNGADTFDKLYLVVCNNFI